MQWLSLLSGGQGPLTPEVSEAGIAVHGIKAGVNGTRHTTTGLIHVLVISQHELVRRQLVTYLGRSIAVEVSGDEFSVGSIARARPDVLVLDLSRLTPTQVGQALDASEQAGARVIALASMFDPTAEQAVTQAGGLYRLKSAGADGLADIVHTIGAQPRT